MQAEEVRIKEALESHDYNRAPFLHQSYKSRGRYCEQLERFLKFYPLDQILVLNSAEFFTDPAATFSRISGFLRLDKKLPVRSLKVERRSKNSALYEKQVEPAVYEYLNDYFRPHNRALYELLGMDFGWPA